MLLLFGSFMNNAWQNITQWLMITLLDIFSDTLLVLHSSVEIKENTSSSEFVK